MRKLRCGKLRGRLKEEVTERDFLLCWVLLLISSSVRKGA